MVWLVLSYEDWFKQVPDLKKKKKSTISTQYCDYSNIWSLPLISK